MSGILCANLRRYMVSALTKSAAMQLLCVDLGMDKILAMKAPHTEISDCWLLSGPAQLWPKFWVIEGFLLQNSISNHRGLI